MPKKRYPKKYLSNPAPYVQAYETRRGLRYAALFWQHGKQEYLGSYWSLEAAQEAQRRYAERNGLEWNI